MKIPIVNFYILDFKMSLFITKILFQDDLNYLPFFVALKDKEHRAQA